MIGRTVLMVVKQGDKRGLGKGEQRHKIVTLGEAAALVRNGDTICTSGFVGIGTPDDLLAGPSAASSPAASPVA
jgi:hypothetical protein